MPRIAFSGGKSCGDLATFCDLQANDRSRRSYRGREKTPGLLLKQLTRQNRRHAAERTLFRATPSIRSRSSSRSTVRRTVPPRILMISPEPTSEYSHARRTRDPRMDARWTISIGTNIPRGRGGDCCSAERMRNGFCHPRRLPRRRDDRTFEEISKAAPEKEEVDVRNPQHHGKGALVHKGIPRSRPQNEDLRSTLDLALRQFRDL